RPAVCQFSVASQGAEMTSSGGRRSLGSSAWLRRPEASLPQWEGSLLSSPDSQNGVAKAGMLPDWEAAGSSSSEGLNHAMAERNSLDDALYRRQPRAQSATPELFGIPPRQPSVDSRIRGAQQRGRDLHADPVGVEREFYFTKDEPSRNVSPQNCDSFGARPRTSGIGTATAGRDGAGRYKAAPRLSAAAASMSRSAGEEHLNSMNLGNSRRSLEPRQPLSPRSPVAAPAAFLASADPYAADEAFWRERADHLQRFWAESTTTAPAAAAATGAVAAAVAAMPTTIDHCGQDALRWREAGAEAGGDDRGAGRCAGSGSGVGRSDGRNDRSFPVKHADEADQRATRHHRIARPSSRDAGCRCKHDASKDGTVAGFSRIPSRQGGRTGDGGRGGVGNGTSVWLAGAIADAEKAAAAAGRRTAAAMTASRKRERRTSGGGGGGAGGSSADDGASGGYGDSYAAFASSSPSLTSRSARSGSGPEAEEESGDGYGSRIRRRGRSARSHRRSPRRNRRNGDAAAAAAATTRSGTASAAAACSAGAAEGRAATACGAGRIDAATDDAAAARASDAAATAAACEAESLAAILQGLHRRLQRAPGAPPEPAIAAFAAAGLEGGGGGNGGSAAPGVELAGWAFVAALRDCVPALLAGPAVGGGGGSNSGSASGGWADATFDMSPPPAGRMTAAATVAANRRVEAGLPAAQAATEARRHVVAARRACATVVAACVAALEGCRRREARSFEMFKQQIGAAQEVFRRTAREGSLRHQRE
ncbi:unnamed protein product, partial [Phaeothamnion confervicola]